MGLCYERSISNPQRTRSHIKRLRKTTGVQEMSEYKPSNPYDPDEIDLQIRCWKMVKDGDIEAVKPIHYGVYMAIFCKPDFDIDGMIEYLEEQKQFIENMGSK